MKPPIYSAWLQRFDKGLELRHRMMRALNIALPKRLTRDEKEVIRETIIRCTACNHTGSCESWLDRGAPGGEAPKFCPNHALFEELLEKQSKS
ncbi:MAG: hypothetical protein HKO95_03035 [Rhodobacteraceae bacterium]|nr:hypothetical protein [Alphaproteobacteria bacterium]NNK65691.1 hypothetical protein [Paracoccaceae bacterium]